MLGLCRWVQANYGDQEKEEQIARLKKLAPLLCLASMEATRLATILDFFLFPTDLFKQDVPRGPATVRRGKLSGFHFSPPQPWSHVTIDAMCRTATCNEAGNNIVHMDRELVEMVDNGAPSVTWHIKVRIHSLLWCILMEGFFSSGRSSLNHMLQEIKTAQQGRTWTL